MDWSYDVPTPWVLRQRRLCASFDRFHLAYSLGGPINHVNRLQFNRDGSLLAAACNDAIISLWQLDGSNYSLASRTSHTSDVLTVAFSDQSELLSGGKDSVVEIHKIEQDLSLTSMARLFCHTAAVTFLECDPDNENIFLTSSIDGTIRQLDRRLRDWGCTRQQIGGPNLGSMCRSANCLLASHNKTEKYHSVKINPVYPHLMVVASSDSVVKLYDRRALGMSTPTGLSEKLGAWVEGYCPVHLLYQHHPTFATYAEFSPCGKSVLATYHSDHLYTFNISAYREGGSSESSETKQTVSSANEHPASHRAARSVWRNRLDAADSLEDKTELVRLYRHHSEAAADLKLYSTSESFSRIGEVVVISALSQIQSQLLHFDSPTFGEDQSSLSSEQDYLISRKNLIKEYYYHTLFYRLNLYQARNFPGDKEAALLDIETILHHFSGDIDATVFKARIFLELGFYYEAAQLIEELMQLSRMCGEESVDVAILQSEIQLLKLLLDEHVAEYLKNNRAQKRRFMEPFEANNSNPFLSDGLNSRQSTAGITTGSVIFDEYLTDAHQPNAISSVELRERRIEHFADQTLFPTADRSRHQISGSATFSQEELQNLFIGGTVQQQRRQQQEEAPKHSLPNIIYRGVAQVHWKYFFQNASVLLTKNVITSYQQRFVGGCNLQTLLSESTFFGSDGEYVCSTSDDGNFYIWDRYSGELIFCRHADPTLLVTIQAHPRLPVLVTGGRDNVCRVWSFVDRVFGCLSQSDSFLTHPFNVQCGQLELPELLDLKQREWLDSTHSSVAAASTPQDHEESSHQQQRRSSSSSPVSSESGQQSDEALRTDITSVLTTAAELEQRTHSTSSPAEEDTAEKEESPMGETNYSSVSNALIKSLSSATLAANNTAIAAGNGESTLPAGHLPQNSHRSNSRSSNSNIPNIDKNNSNSISHLNYQMDGSDETRSDVSSRESNHHSSHQSHESSGNSSGKVSRHSNSINSSKGSLPQTDTSGGTNRNSNASSGNQSDALLTASTTHATNSTQTLSSPPSDPFRQQSAESIKRPLASSRSPLSTNSSTQSQNSQVPAGKRKRSGSRTTHSTSTHDAYHYRAQLHDSNGSRNVFENLPPTFRPSHQQLASSGQEQVHILANDAQRVDNHDSHNLSRVARSSVFSINMQEDEDGLESEDAPREGQPMEGSESDSGGQNSRSNSSHGHDNSSSGGDNTHTSRSSGSQSGLTAHFLQGGLESVFVYHEKLRQSLSSHALDLHEVLALESMVAANQQTIKSHLANFNN